MSPTPTRADVLREYTARLHGCDPAACHDCADATREAMAAEIARLRADLAAVRAVERWRAAANDAQFRWVESTYWHDTGWTAWTRRPAELSPTRVAFAGSLPALGRALLAGGHVQPDDNT